MNKTTSASTGRSRVQPTARLQRTAEERQGLVGGLEGAGCVYVGGGVLSVVTTLKSVTT